MSEFLDCSSFMWEEGTLELSISSRPTSFFEELGEEKNRFFLALSLSVPEEPPFYSICTVQVGS